MADRVTTQTNLVQPRTRRSWLPLVGVSLSVILLTLSITPAFMQGSDQVAIRPPGRRLLDRPGDGQQRARQDLPFAWLSEAAYERAPGVTLDRDHSVCVDPVATLTHAGWVHWRNFPDGNLKPMMDQYHLRVEVWSNVVGVREDGSAPAVVVAFGGTDPKYVQDLAADFRWFIPRHNDQYTQIVTTLAPAFAREFAARRESADGSFLRQALVYSTGHSLGGGLAQQFAYALPLPPEVPRVPRVKRVYAFDPSPVTGFYSVKQPLRDSNVAGLSIDRIYQRDELLASVRAATAAVEPPSEENPAITGVRYSLFGGNVVARHSIAHLACELNTLATASPGSRRQ